MQETLISELARRGKIDLVKDPQTSEEKAAWLKCLTKAGSLYTHAMRGFEIPIGWHSDQSWIEDSALKAGIQIPRRRSLTNLLGKPQVHPGSGLFLDRRVKLTSDGHEISARIVEI
jgi:hypothetical protein